MPLSNSQDSAANAYIEQVLKPKLESQGASLSEAQMGEIKTQLSDMYKFLFDWICSNSSVSGSVYNNSGVYVGRVTNGKIS